MFQIYAICESFFMRSRAAAPEEGEMSLENLRATKRLSQQLMLSVFYQQVLPHRFLVSKLLWPQVFLCLATLNPIALLLACHYESVIEFWFTQNV